MWIEICLTIALILVLYICRPCWFEPVAQSFDVILYANGQGRKREGVANATPLERDSRGIALI